MLLVGDNLRFATLAIFYIHTSAWALGARPGDDRRLGAQCPSICVEALQSLKSSAEQYQDPSGKVRMTHRIRNQPGISHAYLALWVFVAELPELVHRAKGAEESAGGGGIGAAGECVASMSLANCRGQQQGHLSSVRAVLPACVCKPCRGGRLLSYPH